MSEKIGRRGLFGAIAGLLVGVPIAATQERIVLRDVGRICVGAKDTRTDTYVDILKNGDVVLHSGGLGKITLREGEIILSGNVVVGGA